MAQFIFVLIMITAFEVRADFFGLDSQDGHQSKIPALVEKLKSLEMENNPGFEESFNQNIKSLENAVEEEKLYCSGEAADAKGKVLPKEKKQLCFRELKNQYLESTEIIFNLKKKYLGLIHQQQLERLGEIQKKLKSDIEKNF